MDLSACNRNIIQWLHQIRGLFVLGVFFPKRLGSSVAAQGDSQ